ncbi:unnamed protein product [Pedinophyceae sp. YPF-701]|nr:unnamed protein product [Pedinophyceae sp. YPF-701]
MKTTSTQSRSRGGDMSLLDLHLAGGGPLSTIVTTCLDDAGRTALAAASSACMARVMEAADGCTWKPPSIAVARSVAERLCAQGMDGATRSTVEWADGAVRRWTRAGGAVGDASAIVAVRGDRPESHQELLTADMRGVERIEIDLDLGPSVHEVFPELATDAWLPKRVRPGLRRLAVTGIENLRRVPPGLTSLEELDVSWCGNLAGGDHWLPASSAAKLKKLSASCTNVTRFPPDMACLEELHAPGINGEEWLPESSARSIRVLRMDELNKLPRGLDALEELRIELQDIPLGGDEERLSEAYFAPLTGGCLRLLEVWPSSTMDSIVGIFARFGQLERLNLANCSLPEPFALDEYRMDHLKELDLSYTTVRRLPRAPMLEHLNLSGCRDLAVDFLDAGSRANVHTLCANNSDIRRVPSGMCALTELRLGSCVDLAEGFLDDSSAGRIKALSYTGDLARLPASMTSLERLSVSSCSGWVRAEVAAGVRVLSCDFMTVRSTAGMCALEELELQKCTLRGEAWVSEESVPTLRRLKLNRCRGRALPGGLAALEELSVGWWDHSLALELPATSVAKLRCVRVHECVLRRLPANMESLEEFRTELSVVIDADWLPASSARKLKHLGVPWHDPEILGGDPGARPPRTGLDPLPPGMTELEHLDVSSCEWRDPNDFLPTSSAASLRSLVAELSNIRRLPPGMVALREVDVRRCGSLDADWLPRSSAASVTTLKASGSNLRCLPIGCSNLETAELCHCRELRKHDWVARRWAGRLREVDLTCSGAASAPAWATFRCPGLE